MSYIEKNGKFNHQKWARENIFLEEQSEDLENITEAAPRARKITDMILNIRSIVQASDKKASSHKPLVKYATKAIQSLHDLMTAMQSGE
jgi:hypothetical protein|tara:strand:+ start:908 stop:1174 length:267 start_codon:yes stop_codon:yes gene_type:complete